MALRDTALSAAEPAIFDVGIHERMLAAELAMLGLQNIFGMTGMFVLPGLLGRSFNLPPEQIAYLYGMTFIVSGLVTILQSVWLLPLPIAQGPYAGNFAALLVAGHIATGGLVMLIMIQVANIGLPNWIGYPKSPGFPALNIGAGALAVIVLIAVSVWGGRLRRAAILIGPAVGAICYALVKPFSLAVVASAPLLVAPRWFPFGFAVEPDLVGEALSATAGDFRRRDSGDPLRRALRPRDRRSGEFLRFRCAHELH